MYKTTFCAPEIERSIVALCWHHPEFVDFVHLSLDPEIHFLDPALRIVLEMVTVVYWEIGAVDWASVVHAVREVDAIEEVGGLEGLNAVFTDDNHFPEGYQDPEPFVEEYIRLLRDYAEQRQVDPYKTVSRFTGGNGRIVPNKRAHSETDPSDIGEARIRGHRYKIRGWRDGDGLSIKFYSEGR